MRHNLSILIPVLLCTMYHVHGVATTPGPRYVDVSMSSWNRVLVRAASRREFLTTGQFKKFFMVHGAGRLFPRFCFRNYSCEPNDAVSSDMSSRRYLPTKVFMRAQKFKIDDVGVPEVEKCVRCVLTWLALASNINGYVGFQSSPHDVSNDVRFSPRNLSSHLLAIKPLFLFITTTIRLSYHDVHHEPTKQAPCDCRGRSCS